MRAHSRVSLGIAFAVLSACSKSGSGGGSSLRSGVSEVYRGLLWHDDSCSLEHFENCCTSRGVADCTTYEKLGVAAVRRSGDRIAVVLVNDDRSVILAHSEDRAKHWSSVPIKTDEFILGGPAPLAGIDVFINGPEYGLFIPRNETHALGMEYRYGYVYVVDLATGALPENGARVTSTFPSTDDRKDRWMLFDTDTDPRSGDCQLIVDERPKVGDDIITNVPLGQRCNNLLPTSFGGSDDGETYKTYGSPPKDGPEMCAFQFTRADRQLRAGCVPWSIWPGAGAGSYQAVPYAGHDTPELVAYEKGGHVWASGLTNLDAFAPHVVPPIDLGAGNLFPNVAYSTRPLRRGLVGVTTDVTKPARMERVRDDGKVEELVFPRTPCGGTGPCGDQSPTPHADEVVWMEPLGNDDYLVLYQADMEPAVNRHQEVVMASIEHVTTKPVDAGTTTPTGPKVGDPGTAAAGPVEQMCVRAISCELNAMAVAGSDTEVYDCLKAWSTAKTSERAGRMEALAEFLAAPPGCDPFRAVAGPLHIGLCDKACALGGGHCALDQATNVYQCQFASTDVATCNTCTASNHAVRCTSAGDVTTVTQDLDCTAAGTFCNCGASDAGGPCTFPPICSDMNRCPGTGTADPPSYVCDGAISRVCDSGYPYSITDCSVFGLSCASTSSALWARCALPPGAVTACDAAKPSEPVCAGNSLVTCVGGQLHFTDCAALGFKSCGLREDSNVFRCLP